MSSTLESIKIFHRKCRERTAQTLLSVRTHQIIIALIIFDAILVLIDLSYSAIHPECDDHSKHPEWLEVLAHISLAVTCIFMIEIPLTIWSLGLRWYNPFGRVTHAWLHLFDAVIIVVTFTLELVLRGQESEVATLLVILRLWRIIKLVAGVTVSAGEIEEEEAKLLKETQEELKRVKADLALCQEHVTQLQKRLSTPSRLDDSPVTV